MAKDGSGLGKRKDAAMLAAGDRRRDLDGGDAGDVQPMTGLGANQRFHPGAAGLGDVAFDEGAGVEEIIRHQRRSRMIVSESGSPLIVIGSSSGSSKSAS